MSQIISSISNYRKPLNSQIKDYTHLMWVASRSLKPQSDRGISEAPNIKNCKLWNYIENRFQSQLLIPSIQKVMIFWISCKFLEISWWFLSKMAKNLSPIFQKKIIGILIKNVEYLTKIENHLTFLILNIFW